MSKSSSTSLTLFAEPEVPERDKDVELKLRVARYLWHLGYVCPMEVAVSGTEIHQGKLKRYDITDVDVVGIRFDSDLSSRTVIGDCKSGRTSAPNRLFWLRGVMHFFGAHRGYLAMKAIGREARELALALSISLLDEPNLARYEKDKALPMDGSDGFSPRVYDRQRELWGIRLPKGAKPTAAQEPLQRLYHFLGYRYWFQDEYLNVQRVVTHFSDAHESVNNMPDKDQAYAVVHIGLTLLSISLLKMCGSVIATRSDEIHNEVRRYIFGGATNAIERNKLMKVFSDITKQKFSLEPPYYAELLELANRLITFSRFAKDIPRYSDLIMRRVLLGGHRASFASVWQNAYEVDTLKLTKDVAEFLCNASNLDIGLFDYLMKQ